MLKKKAYNLAIVFSFCDLFFPYFDSCYRIDHSFGTMFASGLTVGVVDVAAAAAYT